MRLSLERLCFLLILTFLTAINTTAVFAQEEESETVPEESTEQNPLGINPEALAQSYVKDLNGDGVIIIDAFGDSITRGRGDFIAPGERIEDALLIPVGEAGYPLRVELTLGVDVRNKGIPGERLVRDGVSRFASEIPASNSDIVVISGGSNDAFDQVAPDRLLRALQQMVNIAFASGKQPVLATIPPTCCNRSGLEPVIESFNDRYAQIGTLNDVPVAPVFRAFENTCNIRSCNLLNLPEGLHPNTDGYDVQGEAIMAALFRIDLLDPAGPAAYEQALGLQSGSVTTVPNPAPPPTVVPETPVDGAASSDAAI